MRNSPQSLVHSLKRRFKYGFLYFLMTKDYGLRTRAFTLIETLVAISLLTIAIVAPMSLTTQALGSAYYARDQITAFYLAQEALEAIRSVRDGNILKVSQGGITVNLLDGIPSTNDEPFTVDTRDNSMLLCPPEGCPYLETDGTLYGYGHGAGGWTTTYFNRSIRASLVAGTNDEVKVTVTVAWKSGGGFQARQVNLTENLYRWVNDDSGH